MNNLRIKRSAYDKMEKSRDTMVIAVLRGILIGYITLAVLLGISAIFVSSGTIPSGGMPIAVLISALIAALVGSAVAAFRYETKRLIIGLIIGGAMFVVSAFVRLLINADGFPDGWTLFQFISFAAGGVIGSIVTLACERFRRKRR